MKNNRKALLIFIFLIIAGVVLVLYLNSQKQEPGEKLSSDEALEQAIEDVIVDESPVSMKQGQVIVIKDEKKEWLIEADSITIGEDRNTTVFENIKEMIIYKDEEPELTISANSCVADMQTKDMELKGDVVISNSNGDSLKGEKILWQSEAEKIFSEDIVEMQVDDHYIIAGGLSSNIEMTQIEMFKRVTVVMKL